MADAFCVRADGIDLHVRLTPKADRDAIDGIGLTGDGKAHFKARVRAVPEKGKANTALEKLTAKWLGVPAGTVSLRSGATARVKTLHVAGNGAMLGARIADLAADLVCDI